MENYRPIVIKDRTDEQIDYVIMLNNKHSFEEFDDAVAKVEQDLFDSGYDYDGAYWDTICEKLNDFDFITFGYKPDILYY